MHFWKMFSGTSIDGQLAWQKAWKKAWQQLHSTLKKMLADKVPISFIAKYTGYTEEDILALQWELNL
jgi:hypothetical protein